MINLASRNVLDLIVLMIQVTLNFLKQNRFFLIIWQAESWHQPCVGKTISLFLFDKFLQHSALKVDPEGHRGKLSAIILKSL